MIERTSLRYSHSVVDSKKLPRDRKHVPAIGPCYRWSRSQPSYRRLWRPKIQARRITTVALPDDPVVFNATAPVNALALFNVIVCVSSTGGECRGPSNGKRTITPAVRYIPRGRGCTLRFPPTRLSEPPAPIPKACGIHQL